MADAVPVPVPVRTDTFQGAALRILAAGDDLVAVGSAGADADVGKLVDGSFSERAVRSRSVPHTR